jgi:hypothetical protein
LSQLPSKSSSEFTWTECQLEQLRNQIGAYQHLLSSDKNFDEKCFQQLLLPAENWAFKQ